MTTRLIEDTMAGRRPEGTRRHERRPVRSTVGLRDVARAAGVSTATVSRAINHPSLVSQDVRQRVVAVAEQLGWVPDGAARALSTRRSGAIGAVFPTLTHGDFARAIAAIQVELQAGGYTLLLACSNYDLDQEYQQVRKFAERGVDDLVACASSRCEVVSCVARVLRAATRWSPSSWH